MARPWSPSRRDVISKPWCGSAAKDHLVCDFAGFPEELYELQYGAAGAPEMARRMAACLHFGRGEAKLTLGGDVQDVKTGAFVAPAAAIGARDTLTLRLWLCF